MIPEELDIEWDAIIIGTGMGGATLGYALARAGRRVLFCEKGQSLLFGRGLRGNFAETFLSSSDRSGTKETETLAKAGRYWEKIKDQSLAKAHAYIPFVGSGTGGSSALYGMALERFHPEDFAPKQHYRQADGADIPEAWPISYEDLRPYYCQAESLYRVRGGIDPLRAGELDTLLAPPLMSGAASELCQFLQHKSRHPYALPLACERLPDCLGCQGFLCPNNCKNDSNRICLEPAIKYHNAMLLDECLVTRLNATSDTVTGVECVRRGEKITLRGKLVILAAGGLETPALLLRSACADWPSGLANESGMVGRNLMRHFIDMYMIFLKNKDGLGSSQKELAFNDYYISETGKFGTVQSFGTLSPVSVIAEMKKDLQDSAYSWLSPALELFAPFVQSLLAGRLSRALILAGIMEDLPYPDNQVFPGADGQGLILNYKVRAYDQARIALWRKNLASDLRPYNFQLLKQAENNKRLAHACGTCRFGTDPQKSVLNADNRAHSLSNLYVVDSSFFPTSGGTNPALTIAANALRVAERILG